MDASPPESRFLTINELRLHQLDWGNPGAPALVFVPGFRGTAHAFDGPAGRLCDRFHVISLDVRGRGDSDWSPSGAYQMSDYLSDLEGVVDALSLERFTLAGSSMGGRIAMMYADLHLDRLERLIIIDIGPDVEEAGSDRVTNEAAGAPESFRDLEEAIAYRRGLNASFARRNDETQHRDILAHVKPAGDGRWVFKLDPAILRQRAEGGLPTPEGLWEVLARTTCPTLLFWATLSDVLSEGQARRMVSVLPNGELVPVPGVGHVPTLNEPVAAAALDRFLSGISPAQAIGSGV